MNDKIFLPSDNTFNKCYVVQSEGVIRGYDTAPAYNTNYNYRDYYVRSSYIFREGSGTWSNYSTLPVCLDSSLIVHDFYYRLDFSNILIIFTIFFFFIIVLPLRLFGKLFRRGV